MKLVSIQWKADVAVGIGLLALYDLPNSLDIEKHAKHIDVEMVATGAHLYLKVDNKRTGVRITVPMSSIASYREMVEPKTEKAK